MVESPMDDNLGLASDNDKQDKPEDLDSKLSQVKTEIAIRRKKLRIYYSFLLKLDNYETYIEKNKLNKKNEASSIKVPSMVECLIELKVYLGSLLLQLETSHIDDYVRSVESNFGVEGGLRLGITDIEKYVKIKTEKLMTMNSIGYPESLGHVEYAAIQNNSGLPAFLSGRGMSLPSQTWIDLHDLIELIGLMIVEKEYVAQLMILRLTRETSSKY